MKFVIIIFFTVFVITLSADEKNEPDKSEAGNIVKMTMIVTADREPVYLKDSPEIVTVVTAEEIKRLQANSTTEVLEKTAGVFMETGTGSGFPKRGVASINGLPANYVLVLLNGAILLSEHMHTGQNVDMIPPESIERIEIIKSAASAQYGSDAIGGVINIITFKKVKKTEGKTYGTYGSYKTMNAGGKLTSPLGEKSVLSLFADLERSDGIPLLEPAHRVGNESYNKISLINSLSIDPVPWFSADFNGSFFSNRMMFNDKRVYSRLIMPSGKAQIKFNRNWSLNSSIEYADWGNEASEETNRLVIPRLYTTWKGFNDRNLLNFGADYRHSWFERSALDGAKDQYMSGIFVHDTLKITEQWHTSLSLRLDIPEGLNPVFSPKLTIMYKPIEDLKFRFAFGRGFHAPTVQELYEEGYGHGGTAYRFGNKNLKPEYSTAFSLSTEYSPHKTIEFFINGHFSIIDNFITPQYQGPWEKDPSIDVWKQENLIKAFVYGVEFSSKWTPVRWLWIKTGYSYAGNKDRDTDRELRFRPGHTVNASLNSEKDITAKWQIGGFFSFLGGFDRKSWSWKPAKGAERDDESGFITELKDYQMLTIGAQVTYDKTYQLSFKANNLLGQNIEHLDDALTVIDGEPAFYGSLKIYY